MYEGNLIQTSSIKNLNELFTQPGMIGWVCPICGRGLSPFTSACPCRNENTITAIFNSQDDNQVGDQEPIHITF